MTTEALTLKQILIAWGSHPRLRIARCNVGMGWFSKGQPARKSDPGAYPVRFNPPGTADIVGLIAPTGRLLMVEVKTKSGKQRKEQAAMQRVVTRFGGLYVLARSVADVDTALAAEGIFR